MENWPNTTPLFSSQDIEHYLSSQTATLPTSEVKVNSIISNSESFPINFPIETVKCKYLRTKGIPDDVLKKNINSVYPILHESSLRLFIDFLIHKKRFGSNIEKKFYKDYTVEQLIDRLLKKRAVAFFGKNEKFMLTDGLVDSGTWEIVGKSNEAPPRILENCLSYDEIKLSALLSVSSYTHFINNGSRTNRGKYSNVDVEETGVIIGLIGARLKKPEVMEYQDIVITKQQNVQGKGYGLLFIPTLQGVFMNFYGEPARTYDDLKGEFANKDKYHEMTNKRYFNNYVFARRMALSFDTLLIEANERAKEAKKMAYVYVVGIGLGLWQISNHQADLFMDIFCKRIEFLGSTLRNVSDICFSYIESALCGNYKNGDIMRIANHPNKGIKIHIISGNPHEKLTGAEQGKLLVVSYAWDGNALPGNEFWLGQIASSGDSAAASSTQIAELHNPHINPKVSVANLKIATLNGVELFSEYVIKLKPAAKPMK